MKANQKSANSPRINVTTAHNFLGLHFHVTAGKNFFWDHFLKELRHQAQLGNQAF